MEELNTNKEEEKIKSKKEKKEKEREPQKLFHTYLRNQNKLYTNTLNMIDRKARMMISVSATAFSVPVLLSNRILEIKYGSTIILILTISSIFTLIFSVYAAMPYRNFVIGKWKNKRSLSESIFALGESKSSKLEDYEKAFKDIMFNQDLQLGNQVRSMYDFEKHIRKSFRFLARSYLVFIVGFSLVAILFIIGRFL